MHINKIQKFKAGAFFCYSRNEYTMPICRKIAIFTFFNNLCYLRQQCSFTAKDGNMIYIIFAERHILHELQPRPAND